MSAKISKARVEITDILDILRSGTTTGVKILDVLTDNPIIQPILDQIQGAGTLNPVEHVKIINQLQDLPPIPAVIVKAIKPGPVTWREKVKEYYHSVVTLIGGLLMVLTTVSGLIPGDSKGLVVSAIAALTLAANVLKSNQQWVNMLENGPDE